MPTACSPLVVTTSIAVRVAFFIYEILSMQSLPPLVNVVQLFLVAYRELYVHQLAVVLFVVSPQTDNFATVEAVVSLGSVSC